MYNDEVSIQPCAPVLLLHIVLELKGGGGWGEDGKEGKGGKEENDGEMVLKKKRGDIYKQEMK